MNNLEKFFEEVYKESVLKQTHFIEITAEGFAHSLRKTVFNKKEIDTIDASLGAVKNAKKKQHNKQSMKKIETET